jgi:hypothetical protein
VTAAVQMLLAKRPEAVDFSGRSNVGQRPQHWRGHKMVDVARSDEGRVQLHDFQRASTSVAA